MRSKQRALALAVTLAVALSGPVPGSPEAMKKCRKDTAVTHTADAMKKCKPRWPWKWPWP
jgi:hypothetical protein